MKDRIVAFLYQQYQDEFLLESPCHCITQGFVAHLEAFIEEEAKRRSTEGEKEQLHDHLLNCELNYEAERQRRQEAEEAIQLGYAALSGYMTYWASPSQAVLDKANAFRQHPAVQRVVKEADNADG